MQQRNVCCLTSYTPRDNHCQLAASHWLSAGRLDWRQEADIELSWCRLQAPHVCICSTLPTTSVLLMAKGRSWAAGKLEGQGYGFSKGRSHEPPALSYNHAAAASEASCRGKAIL